MKSKLKILLLYKNSTYASYFLSSKERIKELKGMFSEAEIDKFRQTHDRHFRSLFFIESALRFKHLNYDRVCRGRTVNYNKYNLVITVGGDGTFLEAAKNITNTPILGVNSDPNWSVGNFCGAHIGNFEKILDTIISGTSHFRTYQRLTLLAPKHKPIHVLNDFLICHSNPAAVSRYYLQIGKVKEDQRGSGVWISTAVGSSAAIHSAGGALLPNQSKKMQYLPRELYSWKNTQYKLKGGVLPLKTSIFMISLMRQGVIYFDGSHHKIPFPFGSKIEIKGSSYPLKVIWS